MAMKIRLARGGSKKRPHYSIVAADSRMPRDGRFIEKLGAYNPLLPKDSEDRVKMNEERVRYWLGRGAQPTDRVSRFLENAGISERKERNNPIKGKPGKKALERAEQEAEKVTDEKVEVVVETGEKVEEVAETDEKAEAVAEADKEVEVAAEADEKEEEEAEKTAGAVAPE